MKENRDSIYIYLWEEFNTIYVGRTVNPKSRHYTHKHRESERTYQFSSKHHVEHPPMIIIENGLTVEEGIEREKYWINYYRGNGEYNVLNKTIGGQRGRQKNVLSEAEKIKHRKEYYQKNKEKILAYQKMYAENHKDEIKKYFRERYEKIKSPLKPKKTNEEKIIEKKRYYELHKEKIKKYMREYRNAHKEERKKYLIENREEILLKKREDYKKYRKAHKNEINQRLKKYRSQNKT